MAANGWFAYTKLSGGIPPSMAARHLRMSSDVHDDGDVFLVFFFQDKPSMKEKPNMTKKLSETAIPSHTICHTFVSYHWYHSQDYHWYDRQNLVVSSKAKTQ